MPNSSDSAHHEFFNYLVPSNIFDVSKHSHVDIALNRSIGALTNPLKFRYTSKLDEILQVLTNPDTIEYQNQLLLKALNDVSVNTVDIDHIQIELKLTATDFKHLLDAKNGMLNVRIAARQARLRVTSCDPGERNEGFKKQDFRPFFNKGFEMVLDNDSYRNIRIYCAEANHHRNAGRELRYNFEIEFIPTRLSEKQIEIAFFHLKSVLRNTRFKQLINTATIGRIDTGYIMYGVSQLFGFLSTTNNKVTSGSCIPRNRKHAVETTYVGSRSSHHLIGYDKVLKENKKFIEDVFRRLPVSFSEVASKLEGINEWFPNQASSFRVESRNIYKTDEEPNFVEMDNIVSRLEELKFILPKALYPLDEKRLRKLILSKTIGRTRPLIKELGTFFIPSVTVTFDQSVLRQAIREKLTKFKKIVLDLTEPKKNGKSGNRSKDALRLQPPLEDIKRVNRAQAVLDARAAISPLIEKRRTKDDSVDSILKSNKRAIYVEGGPGSGKTRLIVSRVGALLGRGVHASEICVLAYTNDAANVFKNRLIKEGFYDEAMFVGTFSSWSRSVIENDDGKSSVILDDGAYLEQLTKLVSKRRKLIEESAPEDIARRLKTVFSHAASFPIPDVKRSLRKLMPKYKGLLAEVLKVHQQLEKFKVKNSLRDFNDLFTAFNQKLTKKGFAKSVAGKYKHLILDEVQDTNPAQWGIIKALHEKGQEFFCVGDPAQSMYKFRGASDVNLRKFLEVFPEGKKFYLMTNHRTTGEIVSLCNQVRTKINRKYRKSPYVRPDGIPPLVKICDDMEQVAKWLVSDIESRASVSKETSVLILCRYNKQVELIESTINKIGIETGEEQHIKVLTYHGAKGLEAKLCYVIDPLFSYSRLASYNEELCNTYVALTRAEDELVVVRCSGGFGFYGIPSNRYGVPSKWEHFKSGSMLAKLLADVKQID
ncbi:DEAD/DEAH box helicase [Arsukibacterium indicum]|uniref:DNA 3'-5' helicase n=1 Tax=Arsukibacterium indicum TaxID=2848612 RepID=A0ABS6MJD1_9GAMM|nr:DEAD/DEAH box helicase [Arsukibacterium indicum]MBV2128923.1 DEAD/DEAH box helicase [Arsukibacterium indicum]